MKFQSLVIVAFLFFGLSKIKAQTYELGKVTIAELEEKIHPKDSAAVASVLFSKGVVSIGDHGNQENIVKKRIKIYKKEGYNWATIQVGVPAGKANQISISDVYTYNLIDGKIVKSKLKPEGEFLDKINSNYWIKKITFPDVKEGSVIEYQIKNYGGSLYIQDWNFQEDIPVNYTEFKTTIPNSFQFKRMIKGPFTPKVSTDIAKTYGYPATETTYILKDLPALKEEVFVNNINNYRSGILHELETISMPGQFYKTISSNWEAVAKTIYEFENFGPELRKESYFEDDLKLILKDKLNPDDKIKVILDYVKSKIKWNNTYGYGCEKGVRKAYKEKSGNCADVNFILTAMLRAAGLEADPVLISTRSNGIAFFPNTNAFNYVITGVETPSGRVLLDATDPFSMSYEIIEKGEIKGKVRRQYSNYNAFNFRNTVLNETEEAYLDKFENENNKIELSEYKRTNQNELLLPISETFSFAGSNFSEIIGGQIYLSPMLFFLNEKNPFKQEKREYPVDFGFPFLEKYTISIKIPDNYTVENLPQSAVVSTDDGSGTFKFNTAFIENQIQMTIVHQMNEVIIPIEKYEGLKEFYKIILAKQSEKIVLKKI